MSNIDRLILEERGKVAKYEHISRLNITPEQNEAAILCLNMHRQRLEALLEGKRRDENGK